MIKNKMDFMITGADNVDLYGCAWLPNEECRLVVHIVHGMTEHIERYSSLAQELNKYGIGVVGVDLRGHGRNATDKFCASLGMDGYRYTIEDIDVINRSITDKMPNIKIVMLGFSLGSFIVRDYLATNKNGVSGAIIAGTGTQPGVVLSIIKQIVSGQIRKYGFDKATPLVDKLSFNTYNKLFSPNATTADWLCVDEEEVKKYLDDPLCKKEISSGLFWQMLDGMQRTGKMTTYDDWNKSLEVLLISGECDPVGDSSKGVKKVLSQMQAAGIKNSRLEIIPNARHDIFHECKSGGAKLTTDIIKEFLLNIIGEEEK